jgi:hypothetical protein
MPGIPVDYNIQAPPPSARERDDNGGSGNTFFWPILILIVGSIAFNGYQIVAMQAQLDSITQAVVQMDSKVKQAAYEKNKLYKLASDILQLSATDPAAKQIVTDFKIQQNSPSSATAPAAR